MTLNIYSPEDHYKSGYLMGDRKGLEALKALIELRSLLAHSPLVYLLYNLKGSL